jgi:hypothetical protein
MTFLRASIVAVIILVNGCGPAERGHVPSRSNNPPVTQMEQKYLAAIKDWKAYIAKPEVSESSRSDAYVKNEWFDRIVTLGPSAVPFLIRDIKQGEFFLCEAVERITGVNVRAVYPEERTTSLQDVSRIWLRWWDEMGSKQVWK